jgi:4-amino-4-deoxy-L-arabinose transferase-like glycosyltransferase
VESLPRGGLTLAALRAVLDARWVIAFALVVFGANLASSQMRGDSILYAAVSKNLVETGTPMELTLGGEPYLNKPPLYFWLSATVMSVVGTGIVGAKLGALLASVLLCFLLYRFVARIFDDRMAGMLAVFVFAATYVVYRNTYHARMESLVTLFIVASLWCFWRWLDTARLPWILGWGVCAGLAVLTKGPLGLLPVVAGLVYLIVRERTGHPWWHLGAGGLVFLATFSWWFAAQGTELASVFLGQEVLGRSVAGEAQPLHKWWSVYLAKLVTYDLIWMVAAVIGARKAWRDERLRRPVGLLLTAAVVHLVVIHLAGEKTARYLYQLYVFTAPLSAYGILALRRFDTGHLLEIVIVVFAIGLQFTGTSSRHDHFRPMREAVELSRTTGLPVVSDPREFRTLDERGAFDYWLADHVSEPVGPVDFIAVHHANHPLPHARTLFVSDRVWAGLALGAPDGPGDVQPMTDFREGSP